MKEIKLPFKRQLLKELQVIANDLKDIHFLEREKAKFITKRNICNIEIAELATKQRKLRKDVCDTIDKAVLKDMNSKRREDE